MADSGLTVQDYDPNLAGIAAATGGRPISLSLPPDDPLPPPVRTRVQRQAEQPRPAPDPHAIGEPVRGDPATWGQKRTPDDLVRFWTTEGKLTPIAAQGVALAANDESGLHPMAPGDYRDGKMTSFGTYQHHDARLDGLLDFATKNGLDPNIGHTQDLFALRETETDPQLRAMIPRLNAAKTPEEARAIWRSQFEKPASVTPNMPFAPTAWDEGKLALGNQALGLMMQELREGKERLAKIDKDYKPVQVAEQPKPPDPDPLKAFGSLAGVFATLAAGFSRTPAIAALNGMAGAINAAKEHDWEQYGAHFKAWKENTDLAFKAHDEHSKDVNDAFSHLTTNVNLAHAMLEATSALAKDEQMAKHLANQDYEGAVKLQLERDKAKRESELAAPLAFAAQQLNAAQTLYDTALKSGDKTQIDTARKNLDDAHAEVARVNADRYGGVLGRGGAAAFKNQALIDRATKAFSDKNGRGPDMSNPDDRAEIATLEAEMEAGDKRVSSPGSQNPASIAMRRFMDEHPKGTSDEIRKFAISLRDEPEGVAARKDRDETRKDETLDEKKRVNQIQEDYRERVLKLNQDTKLSQHELAVEQLNERIRRDRAIETKGLTPGSVAANRAAIAQGIVKDPEWMDKPPDQQAAEVEKRFKESQQQAIPDATAKWIAREVWSGNPQATVGMARSVANMTKVANEIAAYAEENDKTPEDLNAKIAQFQSQMQEARTIGQRVGAIEVSGSEAKRIAGLVDAAYSRLARNDFRPFNQLRAMVEKGTNNAAQGAALLADFSFTTAYARALNPQGVPREQDILHAEQMLNNADSYERHMAVINQALMEIEQIEGATGDARAAMIRRIRGAHGFGPTTEGGAGSETLPPDAAKALQPNHETTFGNGQVWTLDATGKPKRVR